MLYLFSLVSIKCDMPDYYHNLSNPKMIQAANPMASIIFANPEILLVCLLIALFFYYLIDRMGRKKPDFTNWPLVGMLPGLFKNINRIHSKVAEILSEGGGSFLFRGPWFSNTDLLLTCHPDDIQHIFNKNFTNYPKGPEFREKFDVLGDSILSTDSQLWEVHRKAFLTMVNGGKFFNVLEKTIWEKIESGLIPVLNRFCETDAEFDLQDIFQRFAFDNICYLVMNQDPGSLSTDLPSIPCQKAFGDVLPTLFHRHLLPRSIWKLKKWLKIGNEKTLIDAWKNADDFIYSHLSACEDGRRKDLVDFMKIYTNAYQKNNIFFSGELSQFLRDTLLSMMFAGSDTTSTCLTWLFWLISRDPSAQKKILQEIETELGIKQDGTSNWRSFTTKESHKLVYLHGALSESLRLFPPVGLQYRSPIQADNLPSGHHLRPNAKIVISFYSIGRMEKFWGKDCLEFKPERWITSRGTLKSVPTYMFPAFNLGPRVCPGKEMAFAEMKMAAATLLYHYNVDVLEGQRVVTSDSIVLHAKYGMRVVLSKRKGN